MEFIAPLLDWIVAHPGWSGVIVLLVAFSESLAVVGLFMPGAALMFGIGALIGSGHMAFWPTLVWAAVGAIAGDGISFWLGRHYQQSIYQIWPFSTHPALLERSVTFFQRHGGKSILLGRFIGPIRPVIPAVAGMLAMPPRRFLVVNVLSGICWAPVYLIPGMVFATSVGLAAETATRLGILGGVLVIVVMFLISATRTIFNWVHYQAHLPLLRLLAWSRLHPVAGELPAALFDPEHRETRGMTLLALILLLAGVTLGWLSSSDWPSNLDRYIHYAAQPLRSPLLDQLVLLINLFGHPLTLSLLFSVILGWLAWKRRWRAAAHWVAAGLFSVALTQLLTLYAVPLEPSGGSALWDQTTHSMVVYGFLAVLIGRELSDQRRFLIYAATVLLVSTIALSQLYLGSYTLTHTLNGLTLGLAWVALLGIAYRHHLACSLELRGLLVASLSALSLAIAILLLGSDSSIQQPAREARGRPIEMSLQQWQGGGWRQLPVLREDLRAYRDHPLTLHYAGALPALRTHLQGLGWREAQSPAGLNWVHWFNSSLALIERPIMPQVHAGKNQTLLLLRGRDSGVQVDALRLWRSNYRLQPGGTPLWIGTVGELYVNGRFGLYAPRTANQFHAPLERLWQELGPLAQRGEIAIKRVAVPQRQLLLIQEVGLTTHRDRGDP